MGKSCTGALTEGTQHRCGKGAGQSTGRLGEERSRWKGSGRLWECLFQVDACVERLGVNGDVAPTDAVDQLSSHCFVLFRAPVREGPEEAVDVCSYRAKAKRRKASAVGKVARSIRTPVSVGPAGVLATGRAQSLLTLLSEICWVPPGGRPVGRKDKGR
jgi:hypothetical protein